MNNDEIKNIDTEKMQQENSEAYLNALRQLEQEKEAAKKAKRKSRLKKICIIIIALIVAKFLLSSALTFIEADTLIMDIENNCVYNLGVGKTSLEKYIGAYLESDYHSEEKEIKKLYKLGKKAFKEGNIKAAGYIFKICTDYSNDYEDKILDDFSYENMDQFYAEIARATIESGDYETAMTYYKLCEDQERIAEEVKETRYNLGISYIEEGEYGLAKDQFDLTKGYKYSDTLYIWSSVQSAEDYSNTSEARTELKARLKNPSSYEEELAYAWGDVWAKKGDDGAYIQVTKYARIIYSATNGFGARIQDTYHWSEEGWVIPGNGYSVSKLNKIIDMNETEIIKKAKSAK